MRPFCGKSIGLCVSLSRPSHVRSFNALKSHHSNLTSNDTQLLLCLSNHRLHQARHLLGKYPATTRHGRVVRWTSLLTKFSKSGFVDQARALFNIMPEKNTVTYNAMLTAYVRCGRLTDAWGLFQEIPHKNVVSWTQMLCMLSDAGRIDDATELFDQMPERNLVSWNSMVAGLIRNGRLDEARQVFDAMPCHNVVSCNTMISGYVEDCRMEEAREIFEKMDEKSVVSWTSMVDGYCRAGDVDQGLNLFSKMPERNIISWTAMIGGFAWNSLYEEALSLFLQMNNIPDINPNEETFISLAYACAGLGFPGLGKQLHTQVIVNYYEIDGPDCRLSKSLIYMYYMFGLMDIARLLYNESTASCKSQSCNFLINGYARIGELEAARELLNAMPFPDKMSWTSMIDGYLNAGDVSQARFLFINMPGQDSVAWTAMISGLVQNELFAESTYMFMEMLARGFSPLSSTYSVLFGAAGATANLDTGMQLHCNLMKTRDKFDDLILKNSLISMYAKCGVINDANKIFLEMVFRDLISWNSIIMGFSHHGLADAALMVFQDMLKSRINPDSITFLGILSACSHAGLVDEGFKLFNLMKDVYGMKPGFEHYVCMINLLGRAGKVKEAEEFVSRLVLEPDDAILGALLGVCGFSKSNSEVAKRTASRLLELQPLNAPAHVALCNVYAANGEYKEEHMLRREMGLKGVKKVPGCSWIVVNGKAHVFFSRDKLYTEVTQMLSLLLWDG